MRNIVLISIFKNSLIETTILYFSNIITADLRLAAFAKMLSPD